MQLSKAGELVLPLQNTQVYETIGSNANRGVQAPQRALKVVKEVGEVWYVESECFSVGSGSMAHMSFPCC